MLDSVTKRRIDTARDILVGKVPDPKSQVEQITIALIYKFMDDMDAQAEEVGGIPPVSQSLADLRRNVQNAQIVAIL
jgi:hypothetical protein